MRPARLSPFEPDQLWQSAREPVFWLDPTLKLVWVNRAWENLTGYPAESVMGLICQAHGPTRAGDLTDLAASFHPPPESLLGQPAGTRSLILHTSGEAIWRRVEFWPFCDENDSLIGMLGPRAGRSPALPVLPTLRPTSSTLSYLRSSGISRSDMGSIAWSASVHRTGVCSTRFVSRPSSTTPVLIVGEPGTGKRQVARHHSSKRSRSTFAARPV